MCAYVDTCVGVCGHARVCGCLCVLGVAEISVTTASQVGPVHAEMQPSPSRSRVTSQRLHIIQLFWTDLIAL